MAKEKYTGLYRLGLITIFVPFTNPFQNFNVVNEFFSNVTKQDLIKLRRLAEQQKEQRAPNNKK